MSKILLLVGVACCMLSCASVKPVGSFPMTPSAGPDYGNLAYWAAHPDKEDPADRVPDGVDKQTDLVGEVDVFFLHPTTYTGKKGHDQWNGGLTDVKLNERTDGSTILYQASIFNDAGRVFAPRYRQAHLNAYFSKDTASARKAFALAYQDVRAAFQYYLEHHNAGRPIIVAAHSQGTTHAGALIKAFFDGKPLQKQLVAAYLIGMPVPKNSFEEIKACETPTSTACFCSWRTFRRDYLPSKEVIGDQIVVTNPLSWSLDNTYQPKALNQGAVLRKFEKILPELVDAQVEQGVLWVNKPKFPGSFFFRTKRYHIVDLNFFYLNVRSNARLRAESWLKEIADR